MYGQGNYAPQVGQGRYPSRPPFQQHPPGPPLPPFQHGPPGPRPPVCQHGPPPIPPQVGQPGHPVYQRGPPAHPQQVPPLPVPSNGVNSGQPYSSPLPPPLPLPPLQAHGGSQVPHYHSSSQQQSQWAQNGHHISSAVSSGPGNVIQPPLHGEALYRGQVPPGGVQDPQHALPPPPPLPPLSSSFTPPSFGLAATPMPQHPHMPSMVTPRPPLPSSPPRSPPHPPASSPPKSSSPGPNTQFSENICSEGLTDDSTIDVKTSSSVDRIVAPNQSGDNLSVLCNPSEHDGATAYSVQPHSLVDADISHSPSDSDMDMEDDITHPFEEEKTQPYNDPNQGSFPLSTEQDTRIQLQACWSSAKHNLADVAHVGKLSCSVSSSSEELDQVAGPEVSRDDGESSSGKSSPKPDGSVLSLIGQTEHPIDSIPRESSSLHGDSIRPSDLTDMAVNGSDRNESTKDTSSPIRLLQEYASDDTSEDVHLKDLNVLAVCPSVKAGIASFGTDMNNNLGNSHGPKSLLESKKGFDPIPETSEVCSLSILPQSTDSSLSRRVVSQADGASIDAGQSKEQAGIKDDNQEFDEVGLPHKVLQNTNASKDNVLGGHSRSHNLQKEHSKSVSGILKVDEFGRLVRENSSDCDSGDSLRDTRRRGKRGRSRSRSRSPIRGRSRSRSRSPHDRRRRRSPWRRRERHGRSRSLSPKRRRSRSRSPPYRRGGESGGDKMRRDKALPPQCFDFIRGKCYRGASCRYLHHESDKIDRSKSYRSKQQEDVSTSSKNSDLHGETSNTPSKRSIHEHNEYKSRGPKQDLLVMEKRKDVKEELRKPATEFCDKESRLEPSVLRVNTENEEVPGDLTDQIPAAKDSETQQSQVHCSVQVVQNADHRPQQMNDPSVPQISPVQTSGTMQSAPPVDRPRLIHDSITQPYASMSSTDGHFSSQNISSQISVPEVSTSVGDHPSHILPPFPSLSQDSSTTFPQQIPRDYNLISPPTKFPLQHSQFPIPSTTSWNSFPPPPPPLPFASHSIRNVTPGQYGVPSAQFQQHMLPPRSDFPYEASFRPDRTEFPSVSQVGLQENYPAVHEPYRSSYHMESFGPSTLPVGGKPLMQPQVGPRPGGEDCMSGRPLPDVYPKSSFSRENSHAQHAPFQTGSPSRRVHSFPGEKMSPGRLPAPSSQSHPYSHQPFYGLPTVSEGVSPHLGEPGKVMPTMSRYASDNLEKDQPTHLSALGVSRISSHFNPYASTFDQPLSSKFSSNILTGDQETSYSNKYGTTYNFSHFPAAAKQIVPTLIGDQYDPLYDSIEPSSNSVKKPDSGQQHEQTDDSGILLRMSGSDKPLDVEEQNKQKGSGGVAGSISLENDEYGETADAEVGAVENGSGEVEIDQVKAPGKTKTSKDSKSMKIFKIAIADFVKEVLKPSWRQGNMSKEAFKTIVKKTVDKVSGAMKSHQIPKSRAKIDHYIESSQRKLTKLVMGYVDKYVKV